MACSTTSSQSVADYLRQTSKGRLSYDPIGSKDIQAIVEDVKKKQNSLIASSPTHLDLHDSSVLSEQITTTSNVDVKTSKASPNISTDVSISSNSTEQREMHFFDMNETIFALQLAKYDQERKRCIQAAWAQRKMAMDMFCAEAAQMKRQQLEELRKEKELHAEQQREQEKAQQEAVIEEKKQWEQIQRALHDQHNQRLNDRVKEVELTQKRLEQQAAEKRQQDIINRQNMDELVMHQKAITALYSEINTVLTQCAHKELLPASVKQALSKQKEVSAVMDQLVSNVSQRPIVPEDLMLAQQQVNRVKGYLQVVREGIELTNHLVEEQTAAAQARVTSSMTTPTTLASTQGLEQHKASDAPKEQQPVAVQSESAESLPFIHEELYHYVSPEALKIYTRLHLNLSKHQQAYQHLLTDTRPIMKKYRFDLQKAVNIPVNAISPLSGTHVRDKLERLKRLLMGQQVDVTDKRVSTNEHPQAILMCKDLLAKKFVKQGEEQVSSKHESAFAIAATIIGLWTEFPDFGLLLLAHFHQKCPVTVPYYIPKEEGQSQEDHYRAMGYVYIDGTIEKQDKFLKRMSGMVRLYAAIICSPVPRNIRHSHPHGIENGWIWLTRILNLDPVPDLTATILLDFLETAGSCLLQTYGKQFQKMLVTLCKELFPKIHQVTPSGSGGPLTRLENFLQKCLQCGKIPPPEGFLPNNFWYT